MDLLTTDGWLSSYSVGAVLLQIRMAMSNLEPRPARLDPGNWNLPYSMDEAVAGFKRAAQTHGWTVPAELEAIARGF
jgi:ubiquitin-conjugating enzyme E2 Q